MARHDEAVARPVHQLDVVAAQLRAGPVLEPVRERVRRHLGLRDLLAVAPELHERAGAALDRHIDLGLGYALHVITDLGPADPEVDPRIVRPAQLHDRAAAPQPLEDGGLAQLVGEHERGRAAELRVGEPGPRAGPVIVAAADRGDPEPCAARSSHSATAPGTNTRSTTSHLPVMISMPVTLSHGVVGCAHAQPMHASPRSSVGWLTRNTARCAATSSSTCSDRAPREADAVIDVGPQPDRVAVAGVRGDLRPAQQQHAWRRGLRRLRGGGERQLRVGVVIAQVDEVEPARARERDDLIDRGGGVAALRRVDVEVALVPAALLSSAMGANGARARRERDSRIAHHVHHVMAVARVELGLADHELPEPGLDRPDPVAPRRLVDPDDGVLGVAAAPAAEAIGSPHAPVEDHGARAVGVRDPDLLRAHRHIEVDDDVVTARGRDVPFVGRGRQHGSDRERP